MFENLSLFRMSSQMATHATLRQRVVAENIANVDTPGYRQRDIASFQTIAERRGRDVYLQATRPGHRSGTEHGIEGMPAPRTVRSATQGPNGNSVSLEGEIMKTAQIRQQHEMAVSVYRSTMTVLRSVISNR